MNSSKRILRRLGLLLAAWAIAAIAPITANAEDIDIFVSGVGGGAVGSANVLIVVDNTSNWALSAQLEVLTTTMSTFAEPTAPPPTPETKMSMSSALADRKSVV